MFKFSIIFIMLCLLTNNLIAQVDTDAIDDHYDGDYPWLTEIREYLSWSDIHYPNDILSKSIGLVMVNPAYLSLVKRSKLSFDLYHRTNNSEMTYISTQSTSQLSKTGINSIGFIYSYPVYRGSASIAFGYQKLKDFDHAHTFSSDTYGAYRSQDLIWEENKENITGGLGSYYFSGAVQYTPNVYLGATLNIFSGNYNYDFTIYREKADSQGGLDFYSTRRFTNEDDISGFNLVLGLLYQVSGQFQISMGITTPSWMNVDEKNKEYYLSFIWDSIASEYQTRNLDSDYQDVWFENDYRVNLPMKFNIGFDMKITHFIYHHMDLTLCDYSQLYYNHDPFNFQNSRESMKEIYQTSYLISGSDLIHFPGSKIKYLIGYYYQTLPFKIGREAYVNQFGEIEAFELTKEINKIGISLGVEILLDESVILKGNFDYQSYGWQEDLLEERYSRMFLGLGIVFRY